MEWLSGWALWLIIGFGLLILELVVPGVFLIWWGFAALLSAAVSAVFPALPLGWEVALFALFAVLFSFGWWKFQHNKDRQEDAHPVLNARDHAMLGARGEIVELLGSGIARGKFGDTTWRVSGTDLALCDKVEVKRVEGITLFVEKVD